MHRQTLPDRNDSYPVAEGSTRRDSGTASTPAAAIAHDLTQPLTAIINSLNAARRLLALRDEAENRLLREILDEALGQSQAATRLVRELRDLPRRRHTADGDLIGPASPLLLRSEQCARKQ